MKILVKDLKLFGYHGVREHEKKNGQYFIFNIRVDIEDEGLEDSDDLRETLSYSDVIKEVKKINKEQRCDLLETLSRKIAEKIIDMSDLVKKVDVRVEKPDPPIDEELGSVGVQYSFYRDKNQKDENKAVRVLLSLGSNMGDRGKNIQEALGILESDPHIKVMKISSLYETEPMYVEDQESFYNIAAEIEVDRQMGPFRLLGLVKSIEYDMGRKSGEKRYGPRLIDIDILYYGDEKIESGILEIPHPRISERRFMLIPLAQIAPEIKIDDMDIGSYITNTKLSGKVEKIS